MKNLRRSKYIYLLVWSYQNTSVVATSVGFRNDIAHTTASLLLLKAGTKPDKGGASCALLNELSKSLECILLYFFNSTLHAHNLDSHKQEWSK